MPTDEEQQCGHTPLYADSFLGPERMLPCLFCERDRLRTELAERNERLLLLYETLTGQHRDTWPPAVSAT